MTSYGTFLGVYVFLTSISFRRVQERAIRSSCERVMVVQRHEGMKQHSGPGTCVEPTHLCARGAVFLVLYHAPVCESHAPAWVTKMSPNLIHFKAHPRGFHRGYKLDLRRHKKGDWRDVRWRDRRGDTLGLSGRRA